MKATISFFVRMLAVIGVLCLITGCSTTTNSIETSSESFANTSEASVELTSSTSPGGATDFARNEQALTFTRVKFERVKTDMALGKGEHLESLATLLGIPDRNHEAFFALTKSNFSTLFSSAQTTPEELLARLDDQVSADPRFFD